MNEDNQLQSLAQKVADKLHEQGHKLTAAESCTGGWICQILTDIAGSSAWFDCGFITYSNQAKQDMLGVPKSILDEYGAVSEQTVLAMVAGALRNSQADSALAVSGIAGPSGGTVGKPVGTVWFAWQQRNGNFASKIIHFDGDRRSVRIQAVATALQGLLDIYG